MDSAYSRRGGGVPQDGCRIYEPVVHAIPARYLHHALYVQRTWKTPQNMMDEVRDLYGVEILYPQREHYQTFVNLRWNLAAKHTDTSDHLIIAHAITEHLPLISSDGKFDFYCKQGLNFIFNKK